MLLDDIRINSQDELNDQLHWLFDSTALGLEQVSLRAIADSHMAIGIELSHLLTQQFDAEPQQIWQCIISILRCLPWRVDPEKVHVESEEGILQAIYRYFGGLEFTDLDPLYDQLRSMANEGKPWKDIVKYACENMPSKV